MASKANKMTTFEKLADRLKKDLNITVDISTLKRTYAGYWQRRAGEWVWKGQCRIKDKDIIFDVGSYETASALVKSPQSLKASCGYNIIEKNDSACCFCVLGTAGR